MLGDHRGCSAFQVMDFSCPGSTCSDAAALPTCRCMKIQMNHCAGDRILRPDQLALAAPSVELRRPFCPLPAGASPPSTASSGGHDAVPCWPASQAVRGAEAVLWRCLTLPGITGPRSPGGGRPEIAAAIAVRTGTNSAVWRRLRLSHTAYSITGTPPDQLAPEETTRDRVAVESVPPTADRPEPDDFPGVPVPSRSEAGSPPLALALGKFWGLLTGTCGCVP